MLNYGTYQYAVIVHDQSPQAGAELASQPKKLDLQLYTVALESNKLGSQLNSQVPSLIRRPEARFIARFIGPKLDSLT